MTPAPPNPHTSERASTDLLPAPVRRVIIVGPADAPEPVALEQALRLDSTLELVRAADAMDALGELAFATPADAAYPEPACILVTASGEPDGRCGSVADFIDACRTLDPRALVLRVGVGVVGSGAGAVAGHALAYDAFLPASAGPRELARTLGALVRPAAPTSPALDLPSTPQIVVRPRSPISPAAPARPPSSTNAPAAPPSHDLADAALTELIVRGESVLALALALIRQRLRTTAASTPTPTPTSTEPAITYHPASAGPPAPGLVSSPVVLARTGTAPAGWLVADSVRITRDSLAPHAAWLASWLRLDAQQRDLRAAAFTDHLTGAWNRRYFERYLAACLAQARHGRLPVTVMLFDIDDFKKYNDRYGHGAGDEILVETVRLLRSVIRPTDRVCRVGGDEFAVVFFEPAGPRTPTSKPPESVSALAWRFQKQICEHRFPKLGERAQGTLTISGGLATYPWDGATPEALVRKADELSMQSKKQGKNALTFGPGAERACRVQP